MDKEIILKLLSMALEDKTEPTKSDSLGKGEKRIVILQRGWIYVGDYYLNGTEGRIENASCIRKWGTSKGLGELAEEGVKSDTKLDKCPTVNFHRAGEVHTILCSKKWK